SQARGAKQPSKPATRSAGDCLPRIHIHRRHCRTLSTKHPAGRMRKQRVVRNRIPADILESAALNRAIERLPVNYNFEIHKTVWRIREKTDPCCLGIPVPKDTAPKLKWT
ncbi:unnamed protein product, partial [Ectocarpus sp. 12 AP-2014]